MKKFLITAALLLAFAAPQLAVAQNENPISVSAPNGWKPGDANEISDARIYIFVQPESENRIEVFKRALTNTAHAETLFNAFQEQLTSNRFTLTNTIKDQVITLDNGKTLTGNQQEFEYIHNDINIAVRTFSFTYHQQAFIFVGYFAPIAKTSGIEDFSKLIKGLDITPED